MAQLTLLLILSPYRSRKQCYVDVACKVFRIFLNVLETFNDIQVNYNAVQLHRRFGGIWV